MRRLAGIAVLFTLHRSCYPIWGIPSTQVKWPIENTVQIQDIALLHLDPGGFLVDRSIRWWPLIRAKTGINMGHNSHDIFKIFKNWHKNRPNFINLILIFPKFAWKPNNFGKNVKFLGNFAYTLWLGYKNGSHFSAKFGIKMSLLLKSQWHVYLPKSYLNNPPRHLEWSV